MGSAVPCSHCGAVNGAPTMPVNFCARVQLSAEEEPMHLGNVRTAMHMHERFVHVFLLGVLNISDILLQRVDFLLKLIFSFRRNLECAYRTDGGDMQQHMLRICVYRTRRSIHSHPSIHPSTHSLTTAYLTGAGAYPSYHPGRRRNTSCTCVHCSRALINML